MTPSRNEPANFWLEAERNKIAIIFPSPHQLVTHPTQIRH